MFIFRLVADSARFYLALILIVACGVTQAGGFQTIFTVGPGVGCDFSNLQSAINAGSTQADDNTVLLVSGGFNNQALTIFNRNIIIDGRYSACGNAVPQTGLRQTITGNGLDNVARVTSAMGARNVQLRSLIIRGGGHSNLTNLGAGLAISGSMAVTMFDSRVSDNEAIFGGGIHVTGALASLTLDENTIVGADGTLSLAGNRAVDVGLSTGKGGGIYCTSGALITLNDARIRANTSSSDGGGMYLDDCELHIEPRADFVDGGSGFASLFQNVAANNGGGLYVGNGSSVFWRSLPTGSFGGRATENRATGRGGAVFLTGSSNFVGDWIRVEDSRADGRGGGFAVQDTSNLILRGGPDFHCFSSGCPGIFGTRGISEGAGATLIGGAIYADTGGNVDVRQARIYDNFANNGSALHISGSATSADLRSVLIARNALYGVNSALSTIELTSSAHAELRYVTMSGNLRASDQFPGVSLPLSSIRINGATGSVELRNSILWNDAEQLFRFLVGATATGSCVFGNENATFGPASVLDPLFVDPTGTNPNYALQFASPAIDRCAASGTAEVDILGLPRPQDMSRPNFSGPYDAGAIETPTDDVIFRDDFEVPEF